MLNSVTYLPKLKEFEGAIPYMYLDTASNVTVGVGVLLATADDAKKLGFVKRVGGGPAAPADIQADFDKVTQQSPGRLASFYRQFTLLDLPDAVITFLLAAKVNDFVTQLIKTFPDYNSYPEAACAGIFDMAYNLGVPGLTAKFPNFCRAVRNKDWATAAQQCKRLPPINDDRNGWTKAQFELAAAPKT